MKLKQIIEDEFGDLDDKDVFSNSPIEVSEQDITTPYRELGDGRIVVLEFNRNGLLFSNVVDINMKYIWWINNKPISDHTLDELREVYEKLDIGYEFDSMIDYADESGRTELGFPYSDELLADVIYDLSSILDNAVRWYWS